MLGWESCVSELPVQTVPSVQIDQNEAIAKDNQIPQHPLPELIKFYSTRNSGIYAIELMRLTDKVDTIHISGKVSHPRTKLMFFMPLNNFVYFSPESRLMSADCN